ncbi:MlaD family protein [Hydrogenophaga sp. OTU3427]|uniref:MlaD family protein n=1 Tax=Hydrogenophaga sp. OTU3427 TaxID=3043856 RepID=UPI00313ED4CF
MVSPSPSPADPPNTAPGLTRIEFKAALLMVLFVLLVLGSGLYLLYARGAFEASQTVVLVADDSEGVTVGMDLTFSGFPIGRVRRIELSDVGNARIVVDVPRRDARWLRVSSVFTMERSLVGSVRLRAYSGVLDDAPLPDGAERRVLVGDATAEIPQVVATARELLNNLTAMTGADAALNTTLNQMRVLTEKLNGPQGALGVLAGNDDDRRRLAATLAQADTLMQRLNSLTARTEGLVANADRRVLGDDGLVTDVQALVKQMNTALGEARQSLRKVDAVLVEAQAIASNTREASTDLGSLRAEVEASLRKVESLVNEINRKWPFARDTEIKLP